MQQHGKAGKVGKQATQSTQLHSTAARSLMAREYGYGPQNFANFLKIFRHIKSLDVYMKH
jgi:hypothetical protein